MAYARLKQWTRLRRCSSRCLIKMLCLTAPHIIACSMDIAFWDSGKRQLEFSRKCREMAMDPMLLLTIC
uniref:Uncharacterized protein n=1 Tax=Arundo donax TaxID=35708 RepID=A0A0A9ESV9_ARUDO